MHLDSATRTLLIKRDQKTVRSLLQRCDSFIERQVFALVQSQCWCCQCWCNQRICRRCMGHCLENPARLAACFICGKPCRSGIHCATCLGQRYYQRVDALVTMHQQMGQVIRITKERMLSRLIGDIVRALSPEQTIVWQSCVASHDVIVCAPISLQRQKESGFSLPLALANIFNQPFGKPVIHCQALDPKVQKTKSKQQRLEIRPVNIAGAVKGRRCLIIDDVLTTGGTINSVAHALAGATYISALTFTAVPRESSTENVLQNLAVQ